jgi:hypothetical protein
MKDTFKVPTYTVTSSPYRSDVRDRIESKPGLMAQMTESELKVFLALVYLQGNEERVSLANKQLRAVTGLEAAAIFRAIKGRPGERTEGMRGEGLEAMGAVIQEPDLSDLRREHFWYSVRTSLPEVLLMVDGTKRVILIENEAVPATVEPVTATAIPEPARTSTALPAPAPETGKAARPAFLPSKRAPRPKAEPLPPAPDPEAEANKKMLDRAAAHLSASRKAKAKPKTITT